jgi:hypothetical protein
MINAMTNTNKERLAEASQGGWISAHEAAVRAIAGLSNEHLKACYQAAQLGPMTHAQAQQYGQKKRGHGLGARLHGLMPCVSLASIGALVNRRALDFPMRAVDAIESNPAPDVAGLADRIYGQRAQVIAVIPVTSLLAAINADMLAGTQQFANFDSLQDFGGGPLALVVVFGDAGHAHPRAGVVMPHDGFPAADASQFAEHLLRPRLLAALRAALRLAVPLPRFGLELRPLRKGQIFKRNVGLSSGDNGVGKAKLYALVAVGELTAVAFGRAYPFGEGGASLRTQALPVGFELHPRRIP